jgi:amino acid transporter
MAATVTLLAFFAGLTILGITESSHVAVGIFIFHLSSLLLLIAVVGAYILMHDRNLLWQNLSTPAPGGFIKALFFGFCAAMLGISGFESSANFVEEQAERVFPKTLRNMWVAVTILNPVMALLALAIIPLNDVKEHQVALLAEMASRTGGAWLAKLISVDAALVLSGAVLTSYVGVNGLVRRLALDRCMPQGLLRTGRRGTTYRILITFFLLSVSVLWITHGKLESLAGVYTLSFLSVMILFGLGNVLLKIKRAGLRRPAKASWMTVVTGIFAVGAGLIGNTIRKPEDLRVFAEYFIPALLVILIMLGRVWLWTLALNIVQAVFSKVAVGLSLTVTHVHNRIEAIQSQQMVFFTRGDNLANLNRVMQYIERNEHTSRIKVVHVKKKSDPIPEKLEHDLKFLDEAFPEIDIDFVALDDVFGPSLIRKLSKEWSIPPNLMFIGCPGDGMPHSLAELGGVRVII